jgi:hypothetical protein
MGVGLILLLCQGGGGGEVVEVGASFLDVPWLGEVDFQSLIVPLNGESAVSFAFPVA